jgi:hypothetical protein
MLIELTEYAFRPGGPVEQVLGQHRPEQTAIAKEFATFIDTHRGLNHTTVALSEQRGGLGKTAAYVVVLMLNISLTGERAAYSTFTRELRASIKQYEVQFNDILRATFRGKRMTYRSVAITEYQSPTAFLSPTKCEAIRTRLQQQRFPVADHAEIEEFLRCVAEAEPPIEFSDLFAVLPTLPNGWTQLALAMGPQDRDTAEWAILQQQRANVTDERTLVLLTHAMVVRNTFRRSTLFEETDQVFGVKTLVFDEADRLPPVASDSMRFTISRNEINELLTDIQATSDAVEPEQQLIRGLASLDQYHTDASYEKTDTEAVALRYICDDIAMALTTLIRLVDDALLVDRMRLCRDSLRAIVRLEGFEHPILRVMSVSQFGIVDTHLVLEIGGSRQQISKLWRESTLETIAMVSALMTNMPPFATRYDRFRRDVGLDRTEGDHYIERTPRQPVYGDITNIVVAERHADLLPSDPNEPDLLRRTSLDALAAQITTAAQRRGSDDRIIVLFRSYGAMQEVFDRLSPTMADRVVMRHRRHMTDAIRDLADRSYGIWFGVEWEGINFIHPRTGRTMAQTLIITSLPLAPRDEIRVMRLARAFGNQSRAETAVLFEAAHACYRKLVHGLLLGIRNQGDVIDELWILDPRWPLPAHVYQRQPPMITRAINNGLFVYFERIIEPYAVRGWFKVDAAGEITSIV